ncbi:hypothetical protein cypCar_00027570 [Cyprinus carpio]|nr:hypothetical protein cypCar_00027570 [Cyprinus carpio]
MEDMEVEVAPVSSEANVIVVSESESNTEDEDEDVPLQDQGPSERPRPSARRAIRRRHIIGTHSQVSSRGERMRRLQELIAENLVERLSGSQDTQRSVPHTDPPPLDPGPSSSLTAASVQTSDEASATGSSVSPEAEGTRAAAEETEAVSESEDPVTAAASPAGKTQADEGEGETCSICFEPWTTAGDHRLAALRCGHLFGYICISRWLTSGGNKCPQCNKPAKRGHIIFLYARRLKALDNAEEVRLKSRLELEQGSRRMEQLEVAQCRQQMQLVADENVRLRKEVELLTVASQVGFSSPKFKSRCEEITPDSQLVSNPIHSKLDPSLAFSRTITPSLCGSRQHLKLHSLMTNTVVQAYNTGRPVWSCCWCHDNNNYVYAGLASGSVLVYDTRDTSTHVQELAPLRSSCPVVSLSYIPRAASSMFPCGGLIAGTLEGGCFWEHIEGTTYTPHILPLESGSCTDIQVEPDSRHCLVTYRPGRAHPSLRCVLMELSRTPQTDSRQPPVCSCSLVQTFTAGSSCKLLTKSAVFKSPAGEGATLVCAGDEATNSTMVWDAGTGALLQKMPADLPVLDICPFGVNQSSFLASLTEKMLKVYKWE